MQKWCLHHFIIFAKKYHIRIPRTRLKKNSFFFVSFSIHLIFGLWNNVFNTLSHRHKFMKKKKPFIGCAFLRARTFQINWMDYDTNYAIIKSACTYDFIGYIICLYSVAVIIVGLICFSLSTSSQWAEKMFSFFFVNTMILCRMK